MEQYLQAILFIFYLGWMVSMSIIKDLLIPKKKNAFFFLLFFSEFLSSLSWWKSKKINTINWVSQTTDFYLLNVQCCIFA
jgi:hypothetical protein